VTEMPKQSATPFLSPGVPKASRSQSYHKKGLWAIKAKHAGAWPAPKPKSVTKPWKFVEKKLKSGKTVKVCRPRKIARVFENHITKKGIPQRNPRPPKVRKSLTPGRVLILLSGKHQGRRVVLLKVLDSGLLVVTGPSNLNDVTLRRVNPAYVIATQTTINMTEVNKVLKEHSKLLNDSLFHKIRFTRPKKSEEAKKDKKTSRKQHKDKDHARKVKAKKSRKS